jgi:putative endonuclease
MLPQMDPRPTSVRTPAQRAGDAAERLVADHLASLGWTIIGHNIRVGRKEVDLVAVDPGPPRWVVLVEVRWRASRDFGLGEETFDRRKQAHLRVALSRLVEMGRLPDGRRLPVAPVRIDLIVVEPSTGPDRPARVRHHRHALGG